MRSFQVLTACFILALAWTAANAGQAQLRQEVEAAYARMHEASASGSAAALETAISERLFRYMQENLASMGGELTPKLVKAIAEDTPDLSELTFVEARTGAQTAAALYRGKAESNGPGSNDKDRVRFVYVKVLDEGGGHKYDGLVEVEDVARQPDGSPTTFDWEALPPDLRL